jgi:hypothetical protein
VIASSPTPLLVVASTGNVGTELPFSVAVPSAASSGRYLPEVSAWLSPSSFASASGSMAAISIGNCQTTPGEPPNTHPLCFDPHAMTVCPAKPNGFPVLGGPPQTAIREPPGSTSDTEYGSVLAAMRSGV